MLEQQIQSKIIKSLERDGWYVVKLITTTKAGIPDLLCLKNGRAVFIEVKRPGGKVSELQRLRMAELLKQGFEVIITSEVICL